MKLRELPARAGLTGRCFYNPKDLTDLTPKMIFQSPYPDIDIPEAPVASFILEHAAQFGSRTALIDGKTGNQLTYNELAVAVDRTASGLAARGFGKGDVFAINCLNTPEYGVAFLAVAQLGGVATMVSPLFNEAELTVQLKDSGAHYLLTDSKSLATAIAAARAVNLREVFVLGESNSADDATSFGDLQKHDGRAPQADINPREDVVALPYSSGTTGLPKGVMLTHYNLVAMLRQLETAAVLHAGDRVICVVPCYHVYGFHVVMNLGLRVGATVVTLPRFDLEDFLSALQKYAINIVPVVPPIVLTLARSPLVQGYDLSKLETLHCGAAPLSVEVASAACEKLGVGISYGYGMTELSPLSHLTYPRASEHKPASAGYCLPNTTCKIVGIESRTELEPGEEGEVCVRGPQVMKGYLRQPGATTELIDSEGWLRTGDIGYADEDGALYIVDRLKELIKYKGRQVAPAELEAVLLSHPAVSDAAVLPSPDEKAGEVPIAFVVLKETATAAELMDYVAERVAPYKKIRRVEFIDQIPKSPAGKILRRVLALRVRQEIRSDESGK
jgi:acyl-CoA synthetase (AMP-forming)/AMP-acid ligase II